MGVLKRISDMTKASIHELLDRVEDPVMMLNQYLREMEEEIAKAEVIAAKQMANERKLREMLEEARRMAQQYSVKAETALQNSDETAAAQALEEKLHFDEKTQEYTVLHEQSKTRSEHFLQQLREKKEQYYEMRNKRGELISRAQFANAKKKMAQICETAPLEAGHASLGFYRMEEKIMRMEAEADLSGSGFSAAEVNYNSHDVGKRKLVEEQLAQLKAKMAAEAKMDETSDGGN